jgi:hypothetical protein
MILYTYIHIRTHTKRTHTHTHTHTRKYIQIYINTIYQAAQGVGTLDLKVNWHDGVSAGNELQYRQPGMSYEEEDTMHVTGGGEYMHVI